MYINTSELFPCLIFFISLILLLLQEKKGKAIDKGETTDFKTSKRPQRT
jgi:hypothetical protein